MNLYVCIKQVPDTETKIKLNSDSTGIDAAGIKWIMSPYDEYGVEEALRYREKNAGSTVTVISAGPDRVLESLRTALAMGADHAIHVELPDSADSAFTAKALAAALKKEAKVDLVFFGKEAIDDGAAQVPGLIAHHLGIPAVTVVVGIEYSESTLKCKREIEGGAYEMVEVTLPAVIAGSKGLNEPRYASLPNIMKAKKKPLETLTVAELGVDLTPTLQTLKVVPPPIRKGGIKVPDVATLVDKLKNEAKVI